MATRLFFQYIVRDSNNYIKISKLHTTDLRLGYAGSGENPPVTKGFPSQSTSNSERAFMLWRHHEAVGFGSLKRQHMYQIQIRFNEYYSLQSGIPSICRSIHPSALPFKSSPPSAAYMRQWIGSALFQIMACHLFGAKPLSKPMLDWTLRNKWQWNLNQNKKLFIHKNASESIVCEMAAILSRREMGLRVKVK